MKRRTRIERRTPLRRGDKPLKRGAPPRRRTPVRSRRPGPPRRGPARSRDYLAHVRLHPCAVCGGGPSDPHHHTIRGVAERGLGQKVTDYATVPLCRRHHDEGTSWPAGWASWEAERGVCLAGVMLGLLRSWLEEHPDDEPARELAEALEAS